MVEREERKRKSISRVVLKEVDETKWEGKGGMRMREGPAWKYNFVWVGIHRVGYIW